MALILTHTNKDIKVRRDNSAICGTAIESGMSLPDCRQRPTVLVGRETTLSPPDCRQRPTVLVGHETTLSLPDCRQRPTVLVGRETTLSLLDSRQRPTVLVGREILPCRYWTVVSVLRS